MRGQDRAQAIRHYRTLTASIKRYERAVHFGRCEYATDLQDARNKASELNRRYNLDNRKGNN